MIYSIFNEKGNFCQTIEGDYEMVVLPTSEALNGTAVEGQYDPTYYLLDDVPTKKEDNPTILTGMTLSNIPAESEIVIDNEVYPVGTESEVELSFTMPGQYRVIIESEKYLNKEFEIDYQP